MPSSLEEIARKVEATGRDHALEKWAADVRREVDALASQFSELSASIAAAGDRGEAGSDLADIRVAFGSIYGDLRAVWESSSELDRLLRQIVHHLVRTSPSAALAASSQSATPDDRLRDPSKYDLAELSFAVVFGPEALPAARSTDLAVDLISPSVGSINAVIDAFGPVPELLQAVGHAFTALGILSSGWDLARGLYRRDWYLAADGAITYAVGVVGLGILLAGAAAPFMLTAFELGWAGAGLIAHRWGGEKPVSLHLASFATALLGPRTHDDSA
ncbi:MULTISPECIES: hypothetical protein [unclassified Microbacterium]|uniref:hypothetical protein n=1 Tax=unclassified Microbacterium TaxID=2609290 RepID=UPI00263126D9|nr:hypothetical protein [Microbacterium sp.]